MQWQTKVGNITTNKKVKLDFTLPDFNVTKIVTWNCYVNESANIRYDMIISRDIIMICTSVHLSGSPQAFCGFCIYINFQCGGTASKCIYWLISFTIG